MTEQTKELIDALNIALQFAERGDLMDYFDAREYYKLIKRVESEEVVIERVRGIIKEICDE